MTRNRREILLELGFRTYRAYLKSKLWLRVRITVWKAKGRNCCLCGKRASQVHHRRYDRATLLGLDITHLEPICRKCHRFIELTPRGRKRASRSVERLFKRLIRKKAGPAGPA